MVAVPAHLAMFASKFNSAVQFATQQGQAFPRITLGGERFTALDMEGNETLLGLKEFEFIAVASNPATSKVYFATAYTGDEGTPPTCWSDNGQFPDIRCSSPQAESCALCPLNVWGSAKSSFSGKDVKACSDFKKLAVYPFHDSLESVHMLRVSPAALKNWSRYLNELRKIGGDCGFDVTPDLVITKAYWGSKNVMDFEFVDFLDEALAGFVGELKDANEFESWIGLDTQSQSFPMLASKPRNEPQRLTAPVKPAAPEPIDAEVEEINEPKKPTRAAPARKAAAKPIAPQDPMPGRARNEMEAIGAKQGERRLTPMEIARAAAKKRMGVE
jgi:hypothetical protein